MKVEHILQTKGSDVYAVDAGAMIAEAVAILSDRNIGAVLVKRDGAVVGILSERDIVRRLKRDGADALGKRVDAYMTSDIITCDPETTVDELMSEMTVHRIRHMPVMREGTLVGIVSIGDVVKRKIEVAEREAAMLRDYISG